MPARQRAFDLASGLASIVFAAIVLDRNPPGGGTLAITVVCTVFLSIVAHGVTANSLARAFGSRHHN